MRDLNIDFMNLYISVDKFIRDAYRTTEGVSGYIREMERNNFKGTQYVKTWNSDYEMLKHLRWIRNQLSHEVGYDSDICTTSDYGWLEGFYNRLYNTNDPMTIMEKAEAAERKKQQTKKRRQQTTPSQEQILAENQTYCSPSPSYHPPERKTLGQRIKSFFYGK